MDKKEKVVYPSREVALKAAEAMGKKHSVHFSINDKQIVNYVQQRVYIRKDHGVEAE